MPGPVPACFKSTSVRPFCRKESLGAHCQWSVCSELTFNLSRQDLLAFVSVNPPPAERKQGEKYPHHRPQRRDRSPDQRGKGKLCSDWLPLLPPPHVIRWL